jgi:hypothetical protein
MAFIWLERVDNAVASALEPAKPKEGRRAWGLRRRDPARKPRIQPGRDFKRKQTQISAP